MKNCQACFREIPEKAIERGVIYEFARHGESLDWSWVGCFNCGRIVCRNCYHKEEDEPVPLYCKECWQSNEQVPY